MKSNLFLVVLGGRTKQSHVELHDVRWVIGHKIEDTFQKLRDEWFGEQSGLHIDSYVKINYIDGYIIEVINKSDKKLKANKGNSLWFVNLGGYDPNNLAELHQFGLFIAKCSKEAKKKAKEKWLKNIIKKHHDDYSRIESSPNIDDCHNIKFDDHWEIKLIPDKETYATELKPDWFGYMRIDNA